MRTLVPIILQPGITSPTHSDTPIDAPSLQESSYKSLKYSVTPIILLSYRPSVSLSDIFSVEFLQIFI